MKRNALFALLLVIALALAFFATLASAQTASEFKLGFKALADQIPEVVGAPLENEHFNVLSGNSEQRTTRGMMTWRKADNWTAFTDGSRTWINGQAGVQARLNTERFLWENTPVEAEAPRPVAKVATKTPLLAAVLVMGSGGTVAADQIPAPTAVAPQPSAPVAVATATPAPAAPPVASPSGSSKDSCLACHGPFDKLVSATANYAWPSGALENPHQNVPHGTQTVPECVTCHKAHPVPPTANDIAAMGKPEPKLCLGCHPTGF